MKAVFRIIRRILTHIFKKMSVVHTDKILTELVNRKYQELNAFVAQPDAMIIGDKVSDLVKNVRVGVDFEFSTLSWDFVIARSIDAFNGKCIISTHRLVPDDNDYPKKKRVHFPDMDIRIQLPINTLESIRFVQDDIVTSNFGKDANGNPLTVDTNRAAILDFPIQYLNKLYAVMHKMQTGK
jgi:hypothetical protein